MVKGGSIGGEVRHAGEGTQGTLEYEVSTAGKEHSRQGHL